MQDGPQAPFLGATKFEDFIFKLQNGLSHGLPSQIKTALYAIKSLDHQKDCIYNTNNRLIKQFFLLHPSPKAGAKLGGLAAKSKTIARLPKNEKTRVIEAKQKHAQQKLIAQLRVNFQQIQKIKERKTLIAEQVFKYSESLLHEKLVKKSTSKGVVQDFPRATFLPRKILSGGSSSTVLEEIKKSYSDLSQSENKRAKAVPIDTKAVLKAFKEIDNELLANTDRKTVKVSFDQNRQLLRGFCLLLKAKNGAVETTRNSKASGRQPVEEQLKKLRTSGNKYRSQPKSKEDGPLTDFGDIKLDLSVNHPTNMPVGSRAYPGYSAAPRTGQQQSEEVYCFCQNISYGDMVACDCPTCKYEWFHFPCVGLTEKPESNYGTSWYCIECLEKVKAKK